MMPMSFCEISASCTKGGPEQDNGATAKWQSDVETPIRGKVRGGVAAVLFFIIELVLRLVSLRTFVALAVCASDPGDSEKPLVELSFSSPVRRPFSTFFLIKENICVAIKCVCYQWLFATLLVYFYCVFYFHLLSLFLL